MRKINFGKCCTCGANALEAVYYTEQERTIDGHLTGRVRIAVDYIICNECLSKIIVDDEFDEPWR